jgi:peptide/nickel transport system permease protein
MAFQMVFLWTDIAIYLLLILSIGAFFYALRRDAFYVFVRQIAGRPVAAASFVILLFYFFIGLADSFHFRLHLANEKVVAAADTSHSAAWDPAVLSLLDYWVSPLRTRLEKSYSAPFAIHAFTKETLENKQGKKTRVYPQLLYGGRHLENKSERLSDILITLLKGLIFGAAVILSLILFSIFMIGQFHRETVDRAAYHILHGAYNTAWRTIFFTAGCILMAVFIFAPLSLNYHILGTDKVGNDVLYLSLKAIRTGLVIGALTTLIMLPFAILLGICAGYFKGKVDDLIQYIYTTLSSVPGVLLIAAAVLILDLYMNTHLDDFTSITQRTDVRLFFLCFILGITGWIGLCRLLRGETFKISELEYVQAASALGVGNLRIILRHILPNVIHLVLIFTVLDFSALVLAEAVLSYVGIGVDPAMISWGNMINAARLEMAREPIVWWSLLAAFVMMFGLVLSANFFSDAVRDALDPRLRGKESS